MSSLTISTRNEERYIFSYEHKGFMSGIGTKIEVLHYNYGIEKYNVKLIQDKGYKAVDKEIIEEATKKLEDKSLITRVQGFIDYITKNDKQRYIIKEINIENKYIDEIFELINNEIEALTILGAIPEAHVCDGAYSQFGFNRLEDDLNVSIFISNLWYFKGDYSLDQKENRKFKSEKIQKIMNLFLKIKNILIEAGIDEEYFRF